ncbi:hypothetical protein [Deinococcus maricopensis]|uniref:Uncharacterized protein n=1 Tax=Deinococcus maricopensis (strain DSM 21211 / LMG 22137 / NRRL B-23946 / LB-34) TaxID=709986 RepID=E8U623_DEIML|nr:hypothetical protein [Deinococcus maricopensis]ADV66512.1 hypothetical protein Deima_0857 [Deinococcus maricopensis DSM 21211]
MSARGFSLGGLPQTLEPGIAVQLDALRIGQGCSLKTYQDLRGLLARYPSMARTLLPALSSLPDLSLDDALLLVGRVARLRLSPQTGRHVPSAIGLAADHMPVWLVRELRERDV